MVKMQGRAAKRRRTSLVADKVLPQMCLPCENASVIRIESIPVHDMVALGCIDGTIRIYKLANASRQLFRVFKKHERSAVGIVAQYDDLMLSVDSGGTVISWNLLTGEVIESLTVPESSFLTVKKLSNHLLLCSHSDRDEIRIIYHVNGNNMKVFTTVEQVCDGSPIMNFAAAGNVLVASSKSNDIHVWNWTTVERQATFDQKSRARGVVVNDQLIILGCDDGKIYIRKLQDMFQAASVIDLRSYIQCTDTTLSLKLLFVSDDLIMAITRFKGIFLVSIKDNTCVAHFQPDLSRDGTQLEMNSITATIVGDASVCYGGNGYCYIFKSPRKVQQLLDQSKRIQPDGRIRGRSEQRDRLHVIDVDAITDSEPASSSGRHVDDDEEYGGDAGHNGIPDAEPEERTDIGGHNSEENTDALNTGLEEEGQTNNVAHTSSPAERIDPVETEGNSGGKEETRDKNETEWELGTGVSKMNSELDGEKNELERLKSISEKEKAEMSEELREMKASLASEAEEREKLKEIMDGMEKASVAAEARRKGDAERQREEIVELRLLMREHSAKMHSGGREDEDEGDGSRLKGELDEARERTKRELDGQKSDFEFLRNVVNMLMQRK